MKDELSEIVFVADGGTVLGSIVRSVAEVNGLGWQDNRGRVDLISDSVILVGNVDQLRSLRNEREAEVNRRFKGNGADWYYGSEYCVELGKEEMLLQDPDGDSDMGESLLDWMLTELDYYNRSNFIFYGAQGIARSDLNAFAEKMGTVAEKLNEIDKWK